MTHLLERQKGTTRGAVRRRRAGRREPGRSLRRMKEIEPSRPGPVANRMAASNRRTMSQEAPKPADLSALRIHREPERRSGVRGLAAARRGPRGGGGRRPPTCSAGRGLRPKKVEVVTAAVVTEGQATTLLTATGYVEAERKADLSPKITSRITRAERHRGNPRQEGRRHRAPGLDGPRRAARRGQRQLGQRAGRADAPEESLRPGPHARSPRSTRPSPARPRRAPGCATSRRCSTTRSSARRSRA